MKKTVLALICVIILTTHNALAQSFDLSVFDNNPEYKVEIDDMDDTGTITPKEGSMFIGILEDDESGGCLGILDIRMVEALPPVMRMQFMYTGEDWIFTENVILKPLDTRYSFSVEPETQVDNGKIYEAFTLAITDKTFSLIEDIIENDGSVRFRLSGSERDVDGSLLIDTDVLKMLYEDYEKAGGKNVDFTKLNISFPCVIK